MRLPILLLLLCPLYSFAQYRPSYTPAPSRPGPTPYQVQVRSQEQAHQTFQRMQAQQTLQAQQQQYRNQQQFWNQQQVLRQQMWLRQLSPKQLAEDQARQQQAEQKATEQLAQLAQEQQQKRLSQPGQDAAQALAQQQEDTKRLTQLTVKTYQEVFFPGQLNAALQALTLSSKAQQGLENINKDLLDKAWWSKQEAGQVNGQIAAHSNALAVLMGELLEFDITSPPSAPAQLSVSALDDMLAKDSFDRLAADQLIREAALAEKIIAGDGLANAVTDFKRLSFNAANNPELQRDPKKLQNEIKASLRKVNNQLLRYNARVGTSGRLYAAQKAILKSTAAYLKKGK